MLWGKLSVANSTINVYLKLENRKYKWELREMYVVLFYFNSFSFHNYLVISTVTYSVEIYTPDTNVKNLLIARVQIYGEEFIQTERKTVIDLANRPETKKQGYVKYQILETVIIE